MDIDKIEAGIRLMLEGLGRDPKDRGTREAASLTARAWYDELAVGYRMPEPEFHLFPVEEGQSRGLIALEGIPVKSICAHHLLPFVGEATVAYVPDTQLCGISNLSRMVDFCARRLQVQESLTDDIARRINEQLEPQGVGVFIRARHDCMQLRGVNHPGVMTTSVLTGTLQEDALLREEFMSLARKAASA